MLELAHPGSQQQIVSFPNYALIDIMFLFCFICLFVSRKQTVKHLQAHHCIISNQSLPGFLSMTSYISKCCLSFHTEILHFLYWKTPNYSLKPFLCVSSPMNSPILGRNIYNSYRHYHDAFVFFIRFPLCFLVIYFHERRFKMFFSS